MADLRNPVAIIAKGILFLLLGLLAAALLLVEIPTLKVAFLLALAIWAFCRFYYFAFYVVEKYVDAEYRFAGLISLLRHAFRKRFGRT